MHMQVKDQNNNNTKKLKEKKLLNISHKTLR